MLVYTYVCIPSYVLTQRERVGIVSKTKEPTVNEDNRIFPRTDSPRNLIRLEREQPVSLSLTLGASSTDRFGYGQEVSCVNIDHSYILYIINKKGRIINIKSSARTANSTFSSFEGRAEGGKSSALKGLYPLSFSLFSL